MLHSLVTRASFGTLTTCIKYVHILMYDKMLIKSMPYLKYGTVYN
jgi:hypothetical protein